MFLAVLFIMLSRTSAIATASILLEESVHGHALRDKMQKLWSSGAHPHHNLLLFTVAGQGRKTFQAAFTMRIPPWYVLGRLGFDKGYLLLL